MVSVWYATREDVKLALDIKETARANRQIDRALDSATQSVDGQLNRSFRPVLATKYFDWPNFQYTYPWKLYLDANELISVSELSSGGVVIPSTDYNLEPQAYGPPYTRIELRRDKSSAFGNSSTPQRDIKVVGLWGYQNDEEEVGELAGQLAADADAVANITWSTAKVGVGDVLRMDDERMIVTARTMIDTTQNLQTSMTAAASDVVVDVTDGTAFATEDVLLIEAERMLVVDIAGNNLIVKRAFDGSTLAAHSTVDIYALRGVELQRASLGTTLALHASSSTIYRHLVPGLVNELAVAEALNTFEQGTSGYARTIGSGENVRNASGAGLNDIRDKACASHGRKSRVRAI